MRRDMLVAFLWLVNSEESSVRVLSRPHTITSQPHFVSRLFSTRLLSTEKANEAVVPASHQAHAQRNAIVPETTV